jgi:hypothetical protein
LRHTAHGAIIDANGKLSANPALRLEREAAQTFLSTMRLLNLDRARRRPLGRPGRAVGDSRGHQKWRRSMVRKDWRDRDRCLALMQRYVEVGSKLPSVDDIQDDPHEALTTAKLIMGELNEIRAKIESFKVR